jgi:SAM-dependent methyltransferase
MEPTDLLHRYKPGELRSAYHDGQNILRLIRDRFTLSTNEQASILLSYDLQAGSYIKALENSKFRALHQRYCESIGNIIRTLEPHCLLEAGTGEATTLFEVTKHLPPLEALHGFDLAWSRVYCGVRHAEERAKDASLYVAELEAIPLADNSFDVVFTSHAIEPNHGREDEILQELYRVAANYLVLFEPAYELADHEARARMEFHGYCRGLESLARSRNWKVVDWKLLDVSLNPSNPTGLLLIEKNRAASTPKSAFTSYFCCPLCRAKLVKADHWFCGVCGIVYPVLKGIPCLSRTSAIVANRFGDCCSRWTDQGVDSSTTP